MDDLLNIGESIIKTVAPMLGTALGGPLGGAAAGYVTRAIFGDDTSKTAKDAAALIKAGNLTPEQLAALKAAENDFVIEMERLGIRREEIAAGDRASARNREAQVGGYANPILAGVVVAGFFAVCAAVISGHAGADPATATLVGTVVGYASAKADQVVSYYFGSSAGSKQKTVALEKAANMAASGRR